MPINKAAIQIRKRRDIQPEQSEPRICFIGPMLGNHSGWVPSPAELLSTRLIEKGYSVILSSAVINPYIRLIDTIRTILTNRNRIDLLCLLVFGGRSFILEDIASWLGLRFGIPIIMILHGGAMPDFMARYPRWNNRVLKRAHRIITPSIFLVKAIEPYGFSAQVIPNGIDLADYPFRQRLLITPNILWMRTFHLIYHPLLAIDVLKMVQKRHPQAKLTMAGQEKGMLQEVKSYAQENRLQDDIQFAGFLDLSGKQDYFQSHDIFINTNRVDNMPVSVVEAAAFGLPIVATNVGGIPYLLTHERNALLVADDNAQEMASAVLRLLDNPELVEYLSINARKLAESHDWQKVVPLWEKLFQEVMANK